MGLLFGVGQVIGGWPIFAGLAFIYHLEGALPRL
jgi:hypothetical protein